MFTSNCLIGAFYHKIACSVLNENEKYRFHLILFLHKSHLQFKSKIIFIGLF